MQTYITLTLSTFLIFITFTSPAFFSCADAKASIKHKHNEQQDLVHSSCIHTRYPRVCIRTLSKYTGPIDTPLNMAYASLRVSLAHAHRASKYLKTLQFAPDSFGHSPTNQSSIVSKRQRVALSDCAEQMDDSVDELKRSLKELQHLRPETFRLQMSNAQTWVSAALTYGDTCLDGFTGDGGDDGKLKWNVKRRVTDVARVTSNALYMINRLEQRGFGKGRKHRSRGSGFKN